MKLNNEKLYIGVIILLVLAVAAFFLANPFTGKVTDTGTDNAATANVKEIYSILTGGEVEVMKVVDESGLYKVTVRFNDATGRSTVQDVFVTKDGKFIAGTVINTNSYKITLTNDKQFAQCLSDKKLLVVGASNDQASVMQLQILGTFASSVFFDCVQNQQVCQQSGIQSLPTVLYNSQNYTGLYTLRFFENLTGCAYNTTG